MKKIIYNRYMGEIWMWCIFIDFILNLAINLDKIAHL